MTKPMIKIHDLTTGEEVEREMNAEEYKQWEIDKANTEAKQAEEETIKIAKESAQSKLLALGLNEADLIAMGLMPKPVEPA